MSCFFKVIRRIAVTQKLQAMTNIKKVTISAAALITGSCILLALAAPHEIKVTKSIVIKAPKTTVYDKLRFMKMFPSWSPWLVNDPEQHYTISHTDGEVGATYSWTGVKEKSKGYQVITRLEKEAMVAIDCHISEPFVSQPTFTYRISTTNEGVLVEQDFKTDMPFPANVFSVLFNLKKEIGDANALGLQRLKTVTEHTMLTSTK